jgi:hypothetical protein
MGGMDILPTALRILTACTEHRTPQTADIEFLAKHALLSEIDLPIDDLASEIIKREMARSKAATAN